jgi:demethylmenaquinone methyltransferase/2-methoxy-6-polyprenyl-1,4-benzoquinol methylase
MSYVFMRVLESAPRRYDLGIRLLSLGHIDKVRRRIADRFATEGLRVLDIGCGTGSLAVALAARGARVTGIDISPQMLDIARQKVQEAGLGEAVTVTQMSAIDLDEGFEAGSFDLITSTLVFSELSDDEQRFVLRQCHRLLVEGGRLVIADETAPSSWPKRLLHLLGRLPLVIVTYALTQTTTRAVRDLESKVVASGFQLEGKETTFLGDFQTVTALRRADGAP